MTWELLAVLGLITYGSRAVALVLVPQLPAGLRHMLDRVPAALFAGLAAHAVSVPGGGLADPPVLVGAAGALVVAPLRSLPLCLLAGVASYLLFTLVG